MKNILPIKQVQVLQDKFIKQQHTLSVSESCTAGLLSYYLTLCPGASQYFLGGVVAYQNFIKQQLLGVDVQVLEQQGAVCEQVALQMARGVQQQTGSTWALSTTGLAGPGASKHCKVGALCLGLVGPDGLAKARCIQINVQADGPVQTDNHGHNNFKSRDPMQNNCTPNHQGRYDFQHQACVQAIEWLMCHQA